MHPIWVAQQGALLDKPNLVWWRAFPEDGTLRSYTTSGVTNDYIRSSCYMVSEVTRPSTTCRVYFHVMPKYL